MPVTGQPAPDRAPVARSITGQSGQPTCMPVGIKADSSGREFVYQKEDEFDKNHRDSSTPDDTVGEGRIYARPCDPLCPVLSYKSYLERLHLQLDDFWQRPRDSYEKNEQIWYCRSALGKNMLARMMPDISEQAKLSFRYTNHSVRATAITALDNAGIEARHIMRASGHESEASIRSYAKRLSENEKRQMSDSLNNVLVPNVKGTGNENLPVLDSGSAGISSKENEPPLLLGLISAELEAIFSSESAFEEVHVATPCTQSREIAPNKSRTTVTPLVQNPAPLTENIPANNVQVQQWWNTRTMNMCPNITNCVVNFNITNN